MDASGVSIHHLQVRTLILKGGWTRTLRGLVVCESRVMEEQQTFGEIVKGQRTDDSSASEVWISKLINYSCRNPSWNCSYCLAITQLVGDKVQRLLKQPRRKSLLFKSFCAAMMRLHTLPKHWLLDYFESTIHLRAHLQAQIKPLRVPSKAPTFHGRTTEMCDLDVWPMTFDESVLCLSALKNV